MLRALVATTSDDLVRWQILAVLFLVAGAMAIAVAVLVPERSGSMTPVLGTTAIVAGLVALRTRPPRRPPVAVGVVVGISMITIAAAVGDPAFGLFAALYVWIGVECALLLKARQTAWVGIGTMAAYAAVLAFSDAAPRDALAAWTVSAVSMTTLGAMAWVLRARSDHLVGELVAAASTDALTGRLNHRGYRAAAERAIADALRFDTGLSVVFADIDGFSAVNDQIGHRTGDEVLRLFADACDDALRTGDAIARVGGDDFAILLPGTTTREAMLVAERLRRDLAERGDRRGMELSASFGVASCPEHGLSADVLLDRAQLAMAAAKSLGRGRTVVFSKQLADELPVGRTSGANDREHLQAVLVLAETLDLRDAGTGRHSHVVGELSAMTARQLGLADERVARIRLAGVLHDIGKIGVPDSILQKPSKLTDDEYEQIKQHSELGARILAAANLDDLGVWVVAHHERPDGRGYPHGLSADDIPLEARILGVTDAYEAMTAERPYSAAMDPSAAATELRRCAGTQFDADVVEALIAALAEDPVAVVAAGVPAP